MATSTHKKRTCAIAATPKIVSLVRYPVKGLAGIALPKVALAQGEGVPLDRAYAIENGAKQFDPRNPKWLPKVHFLQLMQHERLAVIASEAKQSRCKSPMLLLDRHGRQGGLAMTGSVPRTVETYARWCKSPLILSFSPRGEGTLELSAAGILVVCIS